jgi:hypothetical protein
VARAVMQAVSRIHHRRLRRNWKTCETLRV